MKAEFKLLQALPPYLAVQGAVLVTTFLDFPVYTESYRANHYMTVTPWAGAWLVLVLFGLVFGVSALVRKGWRKDLKENEHWKLAAGYLLGALAGFVTLGIRFMPALPGGYFYFVGALLLLLAGAFAFYKVRAARREELFP